MFKDNYSVYGGRKISHQLHREGIPVGRDRVARLMRQAGLQGVRRGKRTFTTRRDDKAARPPDLVERDFTAPRPNALWLADTTYDRTWAGFCYVALVEDVLSRMIVGWSIATHLRTSVATEALEMAVWRRGANVEELVHHSDVGSQYASVAYTERLALSLARLKGPPVCHEHGTTSGSTVPADGHDGGHGPDPQLALLPGFWRWR